MTDLPDTFSIILKYCAIAAVFIAFAIPTVSGQKQHTNTQATSHSQQSADEAGLPSVAIANNYSCGRDEHDRGDNPHGWHKLLTWPAGITAWAIMLTLAAIVWQSTETRRSASASKQAAEAALLSARALVNIERPWLVINARAYGHQRFYFEATNQGKSPAEIVTVAFDWKVSKEISERDEIPQYKLRNADYPRMLFPGGDPYLCAACNVGDILSLRPDEREVVSGAKLFMMYGKVLYYDLLNRQDPPHETRFCFYWQSTDTQAVTDRDAPRLYMGYT